MMQKKQENLIKKQPVVVLVGHIDHGKSSILQKIRDFKITEKEVGGITQHTGAYEVEEKGTKITFIDTPGHEAFSAMRARGAKVADIAILVVAADDGVKSQTQEAILHVRQAGIPMIVAINKIDKPGAQPERVKDGLAKQDILTETRGGKVPCVEVSAQTGKGISDILDMILLVAEMENFQADVSKKPEGVIIESFLDNKRGPIATLLLTNGILQQGMIIGTSSSKGKIKRIEDFLGGDIQQAIPGQAVSVLGFETVPVMGEKFETFTDLEGAEAKKEVKKIGAVAMPSIEPGQKVLNLIFKTDVLGSIEPIKQVLKNLPQEKVVLRIIKQEAGNVNLSDLKLAETGRAVILAFRVKTPASVLEVSRRKNIRILDFNLIYDLVEGLRVFMQNILTSKVMRIDLGTLKTLIVFRTEKKKQIVGVKVLQGEIKKGSKIEIFRGEDDDNKIGDGKVVGLEKNKKEVERGAKGDEIGILYEGSVKIEQDDILKAYEEKRQKIEL